MIRNLAKRAVGVALVLGFLCGALAFQAVEDFRSQIASASPGAMASVASRIVDSASLNMIGAKGAVQISQVTDEARLQIDYILVKQNDEIIRLLKKIANER